MGAKTSSTTLLPYIGWLHLANTHKTAFRTHRHQTHADSIRPFHRVPVPQLYNTGTYRHFTVAQYPQQACQDLLPIHRSANPSPCATYSMLAQVLDSVHPLSRRDLQVPQLTRPHTLLQLRTLDLGHIDDLLRYPCQPRYIQAV